MSLDFSNSISRRIAFKTDSARQSTYESAFYKEQDIVTYLKLTVTHAGEIVVKEYIFCTL